MGSRFENNKLIMEGDGISGTYAIKTLPPPPNAETMAFYFRAYFEGYQDLPQDTSVDFSSNPWDRTIAFGLSHEGIAPIHVGGVGLYAPGFFGLIGDNLNIKNPTIDARYKQAEAVLNYNMPQEEDTIWLPGGSTSQGFRFTLDSNKGDEWDPFEILYYTDIDGLVAKINNHSTVLNAERVGANQVLVKFREDYGNFYLGEEGNLAQITTEGSETRPTVEKPFSGGATHFFSSVRFPGGSQGHPRLADSDGSLSSKVLASDQSSEFDFPDEPLSRYPYDLTTDPNLAKLATYVWMIEDAGDGVVFRFGINMEGLSIDDISLARTSPKTYWGSYNGEEHTKVAKYDLDPNGQTWGIFDDGEGNMKFPGYIVMKFPEKSSDKRFILDHYKIEYFNRC